MTVQREPNVADEATASAERPKVVLASGVVLPVQTPQDLIENPVADYTVASRLFDTEIIDPRTAIRGRPSRWIAALLGGDWPVAFRTVWSGRRAAAILVMGDDVGVPIAAMKFILRSRTPTVMICHHLQSKRARVLFGVLRLHRWIQRFLPYSTKLASELETRYSVPVEHIDLLHNTVDAEYFRASDVPEQPSLIVSAGLTLRDYRTLLHATKGLDADLKIEASSTWYEQPVNFTSDEVHERAELCGLGTTAALRALYATASVIVVPLVEIGHPAGNTTILEGMAMSKPVIATDIRMGGDYIREGETGFLVPPNDVEAMRSRIEQLLGDAAMRHRVGENARAAVERNYSREQFASTLLSSVRAAMSAATLTNRGFLQRRSR